GPGKVKLLLGRILLPAPTKCATSSCRSPEPEAVQIGVDAGWDAKQSSLIRGGVGRARVASQALRPSATTMGALGARERGRWDQRRRGERNQGHFQVLMAQGGRQGATQGRGGQVIPVDREGTGSPGADRGRGHRRGGAR